VSLSPFQRLLEDVLREELLTMGLDYSRTIHSITEKRDGGTFTIRFYGESHDLEIVEPAEHPSRDGLAALLRRKLETSLTRRTSDD